MAKRNYTTEAYEQIKNTIEQIDNTDVHPVKDFFGDLILRIGQFLEIFTVDQYEEDMQKWYDIVLDSHDSTISEVDAIFDAVGVVDAEYQNIMDGVVSSITDFRNTLNCLRDVISGKTSLADGKVAADGYLAAGKNSLYTAYDTILTKMEKQNIIESGLAFIGDFIKLGGAFCALLVPAGPVEYAAKGKKFADAFIAFLGDSGAFASGVLLESIFGWGSLFGMDRKNYLDFRASQLMQMKEYKDMNSISDWLGGIAEDMEETLEDCPTNSPYYSVVKAAAEGSQIASTTAEGLDLAADLYDIGKDIKDIHDYLEDGIFSSKSIKKMFSNWLGVPTKDWNDPNKHDGNVFKTLGTIWSYGEKMYSDPGNVDELEKVFFGKFKDTKFLKDVFDFARDLDEYSSNLGSGGSQSGSGGVKGGRYGWSLRKTGVS